MLVPKNTSVIVARVPVAAGNKKSWDKPDLPLPVDDDDLGQIRYDRIVKNADLVNANASEDDKVKAMITQSSQEYDPSKYVKSRSMTGPLPPTYTCYRCGKQGHWIKNCPTNNPDVKRSTGIPRSFMVPVDGPEHKGALLTSSGDYAVPLIDHQAYKEVKKEKPPFVPQEEPATEPEAQIPEELLCMVCKDLLQDAVLIPCCGNSFCDECVRQVLLESDNHECPVCHETEVSPNTLIPNRFLRTAVLNFKNETGYTRVKKVFVAKSPPGASQSVDSPQPSPDSTVENQPQQQADTVSVNQSESIPLSEEKEQCDDVKEKTDPPVENVDTSLHSVPEGSLHSAPEGSLSPKQKAEEEPEDTQPGTPLADEPPVDVTSQSLPIQAIGQDSYHSEQYDYYPSSKQSRHDAYNRYREDYSPSSEPRPISTIETITNIRKTKYVGRLAPVRQQFPNQRPHREERSDTYTHERDDYHGRYERRRGDRGSRTSHQSHYDRSPRESRYHISEHQERYRTPPLPIPLAPAVPTQIYAAPSVPPLLPTPQVFAPQPPPPGASPIETSHMAAQPPPPGVGPLLPPSVSGDPTSFTNRPYDTEDPLKETKKIEERSIDDRFEAFQRQLEKRDREREYSRDRGSRSRSLSSDRERSRSSSRSRSYSSKSWTRSPSRSSSRSPRSRSHTPFSSRSRSRSYSPSRSRSWSKARSYTRSRSRTRTESSRSRSRSRPESRLRRRGVSRDRLRSPRPRTRSRSFSPKEYRPPSHRGMSYSGKHNYTPPQYGGGASYQSHYGPPPSLLPLPVMRPPTFAAHHMHSLHPPAQPIHSRPIEQYPVERPPKYPPSYSDQYPPYNMYQPKYQHQRFERDPRGMRYDKRQEYQRHPEEFSHRIPGLVGDRSREYKPRFRQPRDQQRGKEIKELPKVPEPEIKIVHSKDSENIANKKKEEKAVLKHKKHHHHHKNKELKKQENKIPVMIGIEKHAEASRNLIKVEVVEKINENKPVLESSAKVAKNVEKVKDKKHKHKKHKVPDQPGKKKKSTKKEKLEGAVNTDSDLSTKVKVKKKKSKLKAVAEEKNPLDTQEQVSSKPETSAAENENLSSSKSVPAEDLPAKSNEDESVNDTLNLFPDEAESETVILNAETTSVVDSNGEVVCQPGDNGEIIDTEEIEVAVSEEELAENEENVLHVDVPGLSKWEREEIDDDFVTRPQRKSAVIVPKDEKGALSSDIIQRAELVILSKPFKPRIDTKEKDSKDSSEVSSPETASNKHKDVPELKSVVNSERLASPTLQVTISTTKEKRSVHSKPEEIRSSRDGKQRQSSRTKAERANLSSKDEHKVHRTITVHSSKSDEKVKDRKNKISDRQDRREVNSSSRNSSRDRREYSHRNEREKESRRDDIVDEDMHIRESRKHRFAEQEKYSKNMDYSPHSGRSDRRKPYNDYMSQARSRRHYERDPPHLTERSRKPGTFKRSHSRSYDSSDSYYSNKRRQNDQQRMEQSEDYHSHRSNRERHHTNYNEVSHRKHSPVKPPDKHNSSSDHSKSQHKDFHDDLKFEPDYDEYSDPDEKIIEHKDRPKRKSLSPATSRKRLKTGKLSTNIPESAIKEVQKTDKSSLTSSASSSAASESDSSESDDQKGSKNKTSDTDHKQKHKKSRHKKHKKHKHKHKKKKSHKLKQRD
ncbi:E3 ubiquitin-protein ligase RBBP6-like isoform X2 [Stegodyphus dumicola]|uniref:E3 ubiquitin-protein ligase RBBP6-like isoform X2 n=1 Tax=Stegodyphus dumicola TaxID=202533 RepID=UPI0015AAA124|nr:E3 ubiquitin-protein ligase RBBP6-like isoform X2 [Stegodyphus dumicola]